ncbi:MAG: type II toxin-antitoxin system VapC family toxin [Actinomycetota bacterium]
MIAYFETSALLKLMLNEEGAEQAATLWASADVVVAGRLAYPEARAALAAAVRGGRLSAPGHNNAVGQLQRRWRQLHVVDLDQDLAEAAGDLAERHALRGYDAVHLASALAVGRRETLLATWDTDLATAARDAGLAVFPA